MSTYIINEKHVKDQNWFTLTTTKQPNDLDINLSWDIKIATEFGRDEMYDMLNYELVASIKQALIKQIMNSIDVYNHIWIKHLNNKEDIKTIPLDDCTHVVMTPTVVALAERMLKFELNKEDIHIFGTSVGISNVGCIEDVVVFRDTLSLKDYVLKLTWTKELPLAKVHIDLYDRIDKIKVKITASDFDPNVLKPELILIDTELFKDTIGARIFLY